MTRTLPEHGTRACYLRGCRRPECRQAHQHYMARLKLDHHRGQRRRVDAAPAAQRVRELLAAGWLYTHIADVAATSRRAVAALAHGDVRTIAPRTETAILSVQPDTAGPATIRTDPLGPVDLVAVERALDHGRPLPPLTAADRRHAAITATARGWSAHDIASRLNIAERTVTRWRRQSREATP
ncbi:helix-turn-helix domain-containing protein [Streptomyces sp. DSM 44917]|uniref:Helix-turn-helix domain-containing protein n=1 Tax=Streptomyces boetiae TaxID=3075541 RepID=A0ABU2L3N0_9ACTN|nr:helix-turn-helix domain-containing protein [Streptomyces sp. DSM 44917]MDT0306167.1 helix-turn-helix domain-containing protein [Streptomyces sp. DSM 44917]